VSYFPPPKKKEKGSNVIYDTFLEETLIQGDKRMPEIITAKKFQNVELIKWIKW
jgi:hypothetical protein